MYLQFKNCMKVTKKVTKVPSECSSIDENHFRFGLSDNLGIETQAKHASLLRQMAHTRKKT